MRWMDAPSPITPYPPTQPQPLSLPGALTAATLIEYDFCNDGASLHLEMKHGFYDNHQHIIIPIIKNW